MTVCIVGAGAAGLMAAISAASIDGVTVRLFEKNGKPGEKIRMTGNGRCNVTNDASVSDLSRSFFAGGKFLTKAFYGFGPEDLRGFLKELGVATVVEDRGRVFPASGRAEEIVFVLKTRALELGVQLHTDEPVVKILLGPDGSAAKVATKQREYPADAIILCTGGLSYPATGSTGDGYSFARELGHTIVSCRAGLAPIALETDDLDALRGVSLRDIRVSLLKEGRSVITGDGDLLFTHKGITGPAVFRISRYIEPEGQRSERPYRIAISLAPNRREEDISKDLLARITDNPNRQLLSALRGLSPESYLKFLCAREKIDPSTPCRTVTREMRTRLQAAILGAEYTVGAAPDIADAMVTVGGVSTNELNPRTMESKLVPGLYFAGELLDVDADTGGFNLQAAFSTGHLAGISAATAASRKGKDN